jgi:hypothetical protein
VSSLHPLDQARCAHAVDNVLGIIRRGVICWPSKADVEDLKLDPINHGKRAIRSTKASVPLTSSNFKSLNFQFSIGHLPAPIP